MKLDTGSKNFVVGFKSMAEAWFASTSRYAVSYCLRILFASSVGGSERLRNF